MLEDVEDGYVTVRRAALDYGVVIEEVDRRPRRVPDRPRRRPRSCAPSSGRRAPGKLDEDPEAVAERFRAGELDTLDLVRHYGVILDWGTGELLPRTTEQYRDMLKQRAAGGWSAVD